MNIAQNKCPKCTKTVYFQEQQLYNGVPWHKACFRCTTCGTRLESGKQTDHENMPYCKACYDKQFRQKGYGAGLTVDSYVAPAKPAEQAANAAPVNASAASATPQSSFSASAQPRPAPPAFSPPSSSSSSSASSAPVAPKFCTDCGKPNGGGKFCMECGKKW